MKLFLSTVIMVAFRLGKMITMVLWKAIKRYKKGKVILN